MILSVRMMRDWKERDRKNHEKTSHLLTPNYCFQCFEELADLEEDCPICSHDNRQTLEHLKSLDQVFTYCFACERIYLF